MTALLIIAALVALYIAWRVYSQTETEKKDRALARSIQALPKEPDVFGEKFPDPKPLKTQTLEEWLEEHPEKPSPQPAQEVETKPEPKTPDKPFLAGKLLPPKPHPAQTVPHIRKRKGKK